MAGKTGGERIHFRSVTQAVTVAGESSDSWYARWDLRAQIEEGVSSKAFKLSTSFMKTPLVPTLFSKEGSYAQHGEHFNALLRQRLVEEMQREAVIEYSREDKVQTVIPSAQEQARTYIRRWAETSGREIIIGNHARAAKAERQRLLDHVTDSYEEAIVAKKLAASEHAAQRAAKLLLQEENIEDNTSRLLEISEDIAHILEEGAQPPHSSLRGSGRRS